MKTDTRVNIFTEKSSGLLGAKDVENIESMLMNNMRLREVNKCAGKLLEKLTNYSLVIGWEGSDKHLPIMLGTTSDGIITFYIRPENIGYTYNLLDREGQALIADALIERLLQRMKAMLPVNKVTHQLETYFERFQVCMEESWDGFNDIVPSISVIYYGARCMRKEVTVMKEVTEYVTDCSQV